MITDEQRRMIWGQLFEAPDVSAVLHILHTVGLDDGHRFLGHSKQDYDLVAQALARLKAIADDDMETFRAIAVHRVLPFLDQEPPDTAEYEASRCRHLLVEWHDGFPAARRAAVTQQLLDTLVRHLNEGLALTPTAPGIVGRLESICWTLAVLGVRRADVVAALWRVVAWFPEAPEPHPADVALSALSDLGLTPTEERQVLDATHRRVLARADQAPLAAHAHILRTLAHPSSIDVVATAWLTPHEGAAASFGYSIGLGVLGAIADAADRWTMAASSQTAKQPGRHIADQVWRVITGDGQRVVPHLRGEVVLGGSISASIASPKVIPTLLREFERFERIERVEAEGSGTPKDPADPADPMGKPLNPPTAQVVDAWLHRFYTLTLRLGECVRPQQVAGWRLLDVGERVRILEQVRRVATRNTGLSGRFQSLGGMAKEGAWHTALSLGAPEALTWLWEAILPEANAYLQRSLLDLLAAFRLRNIPEQLLRLIQEPQDIRAPNDHLPAQFGANAFVASSATPQAFAALLRCGIRLDGQWGLDESRHLAHAAVQLARDGDVTAQELLWGLTLPDGPDTDRTAAVVALEELAALQLLRLSTEDIITRIIPLLDDEGRSAYQRTLLVIIAGTVLDREHRALPEQLETILTQWAVGAQDLRQWAALQTLAEFKLLLPRYPNLLSTALNLEHTAAGWQVKPLSEREARQFAFAPQNPHWVAVVCTLYRSAPDAFTPVVLACLTQHRARFLRPLLDAVLHRYTTPQAPPASTDVIQAFLRTIDPRSSVQGEVKDLLDAFARVAPDAFVTAQLATSARDWPTAARAALADALGAVVVSTETSRQQQLKHLLRLTSDGQFLVRRAAYRAIRRAQPAALTAACLLWVTSADADLRRRAAEAAGWLPETADDVDGNVGDKVGDAGEARAVYQRLRADAERVVREDAAQARAQQLSRHWARTLQQAVLLPENREVWENTQILDRWPMGKAYARLSDDETLDTLREYLRRPLPIHVRSWFLRLLEEGQEAWEASRKHWPEPWNDLEVTYQVTPSMIEYGAPPQRQLVPGLLMTVSSPAVTTTRVALFTQEDAQCLPQQKSARGVLRTSARPQFGTHEPVYILRDTKFPRIRFLQPRQAPRRALREE